MAVMKVKVPRFMLMAISRPRCPRWRGCGGGHPYHAVQRHICQRCTGKRLLCRAHLSPAAVHQQKIRLLPEPVAAGLAILGLRGVFFVFRRPAGHGLRQ